MKDPVFGIYLKQCPCCGHEARFTIHGEKPFSVRVECTDISHCGLMQEWFDTYEEAANAWNRRAEVK